MAVSDITLENLDAKVDALSNRLDAKIDTLAADTKAGFVKAFEQTQGGFDDFRTYERRTSEPQRHGWSPCLQTQLTNSARGLHALGWRGRVGPTLVVLRRCRVPFEASKTATHLNERPASTSHWSAAPRTLIRAPARPAVPRCRLTT